MTVFQERSPIRSIHVKDIKEARVSIGFVALIVTSHAATSHSSKLWQTLQHSFCHCNHHLPHVIARNYWQESQYCRLLGQF